MFEAEWSQASLFGWEAVIQRYTQNNGLKRQADGEPADIIEKNQDPLYCPACNKTFENENVFHHHKKGKKHIKAIAKLNKRKMAGNLEIQEEQPSEFS